MTRSDPNLASIEPIPPEKRSDPAIRRALSGPALRSYFNIVERWRLTAEDQRALLGWPSPSTFFNYKKGGGGVLGLDILTRISIVLGIFKDLHILYPEDVLADSWVRLPNTNSLFMGNTPVAFMATGGQDAMFKVRRLLDGRRGGWN